MIEFAGRTDFSEIVSLWHKVFGDSENIVLKYLERFFDRVLVFREGGRILGMLSLLPISVREKTGYYVYAVATAEESRGKGVASKLLEYSKKLCGDEKFLILVPASASLFDFYKRFDFSEINCITKKVLTSEVGASSLPITPVSSTEILILRKEFFESRDFFEWDIDVLDLMHDFGTRFFRIGEKSGFLICDVFENEINIKELCTFDIDTKTALAAVRSYFNVDVYAYTLPKPDSFPSAMVWGAEFKNPYFNLALD